MIWEKPATDLWNPISSSFSDNQSKNFSYLGTPKFKVCCVNLGILTLPELQLETVFNKQGWVFAELSFLDAVFSKTIVSCCLCTMSANCCFKYFISFFDCIRSEVKSSMGYSIMATNGSSIVQTYSWPQSVAQQTVIH